MEIIFPTTYFIQLKMISLLIHQFEKKYVDYFRRAAGIIRIYFWRLRGARIGSGSAIGRDCIVYRPWHLYIGASCSFEHGVFIKITTEQSHVHFGNNIFVGCNVEFDISKELTIGNNTLIAPGCFITDHNHSYEMGQLIVAQGCKSRAVHIGSDVWLGANVIVLPGVTIGNGAVIGANAVVTRDVDAMTVMVGAQAVFARNR